MPTDEEIQDVSFKKARFGGYNIDEVDEYVEKTAAEFEELKKENEALQARVAEIQDKVNKIVEEKEGIELARANAEKDAAVKMRDAEAEAARILAEARQQADAVIEDANKRIIQEKEMIARIQKEASDIRTKLIEAYELQIDALKFLPDKEEAAAEKEKLDKKYPTERYSDKHDESAPIEDDAFTTIEEAVEDATAETEETAAAAAGSLEADGTIQIEKAAFEKKFGKLKFGDNYDVKAE